ncbi:MAG: glycosyltransferase family 25 protein [Bacteroidota bacterium]
MRTLVGIFTHDAAKQRQADCYRWLYDLRRQGLDCLFVLGNGGAPERLDGDRLYLPCSPAGYPDLPARSRLFAKYALEHGYDYCFKCDDDTTICPRCFSEYSTAGRDYVGRKWTNNGRQFGYAQGGAGYFLSRKAMQAVASSGMQHGNEDQEVGLALHAAGIAISHEPRFYHRDYRSDWITLHTVPRTFIDRAVIINLARRMERMPHAYAQLAFWPFVRPARFEGIDGKNNPGAAGYGGFHWNLTREGAWGCRESHCAVLRQAIADGVETLCVLEDDFELCPKFAEKVSYFLPEVPADWELIMLGGQHGKRPTKVSRHVYRAWSTVRTHAYLVRRAAMPRVLALWEGMTGGHVDTVLAAHFKEYVAYCPEHFLIGQAAGMVSDIAGKQERLARFWSTNNPPRDRRGERAKRQLLLGVTGKCHNC